jgi:hypothetical protein
VVKLSAFVSFMFLERYRPACTAQLPFRRGRSECSSTGSLYALPQLSGVRHSPAAPAVLRAPPLPASTAAFTSKGALYMELALACGVLAATAAVVPSAK